ncbi:MAG: chemotaxis protein CheW [Candidatus Acidiferrales bacterium]
MKFALQESAKARRGRRSEAVILFTVANQHFAIAAEAVQEIRSTDSLAGAAVEMGLAEMPKVKHRIERNQRAWYVVNASVHFGLRVTRPTLVLILRQARAAVLVDKIERMAEIAAVHALPLAFTGDERRWYRGLAYIDDQVIPVVAPSGFLAPAEIEHLDRITKADEAKRELEGAVQA